MTSTLRSTTADEDLLSNAQFDPVFDADGNLVDIVHLEINTDRSRGIKAMLELANSHQKDDGQIFQDGWTGKQKRILNNPAPGPAHTIKRSKRWDAATRQFVPTATLLLPFEVVWVLFEEVFGGNYSIEVKEITYESEDVPESGIAGAQDLPGRIFYARARVALTVHLMNGSSRVYEGIGVAYDSVRIDMTGNVYAINSARRTAEKGAVSDAKREALANMGRVFRRAFEDGAEALRVIEDKLMEKMRSLNSTPKTTAAPKTVSAPKLKTATPTEIIPTRDEEPSDYVPMDAVEDAAKQETSIETQEQEKESTSDTSIKETHYTLMIKSEQKTFTTANDVYDTAVAALEDMSAAERDLFLEINKTTLIAAEQADELGILSYQGLIELVSSEDEKSTETTDTTQPEETQEVDTKGYKLAPAKMTGEAILEAYQKAFENATPETMMKILDANTDLAKRLTKRQKAILATMTINR